jgi:hypothetical protein
MLIIFKSENVIWCGTRYSVTVCRLGQQRHLVVRSINNLMNETRYYTNVKSSASPDVLATIKMISASMTLTSLQMLGVFSLLSLDGQ